MRRYALLALVAGAILVLAVGGTGTNAAPAEGQAGDNPDPVVAAQDRGEPANGTWALQRSNKDKHAGHRKKPKKQEGQRPGENRDATRPPQSEDLGDSLADIPVDWLLAGLGISAAIGAAGGQIYKSITAPRH